MIKFCKKEKDEIDSKQWIKKFEFRFIINSKFYYGTSALRTLFIIFFTKAWKSDSEYLLYSGEIENNQN